MFESDRFLKEFFHNPAGLCAFLLAYGCAPPNDFTVEKWFQRGTVPGQWLPVLLAYLEIDRGAPVSVIGFLGRSK